MNDPDATPPENVDDDVHRYEKVKAIFLNAIALDPPLRTQYLTEACAADASLRADVDALLAADDAGARTDGKEHDSNPSDMRDEPLPTRVGDYRILERIGAGAMGVVYKAEQDRPRRVVAVKVLATPRYQKSSDARFVREAEILANVQHPGIAQIHECGRTDDGPHGRPFFAMEYIEGTTVTEYCDRRSLTIDARVELLARICDAVEHAHRRDIVHRDLKPGNVLVTAEGDPKVLDFGIARRLGSDQSTLATREGEIIGTLAYMSPEQAHGHISEVDARSDVYSLGAMLYELLTGRLPIELRGLTIGAALSEIREREPAPLSIPHGKLATDLAIITGAALRKERKQRYASAGALGADLRRYLHHQPIVSRPPTVLYHLSKFARRHRAFVAAAAVFVVMLVSALIGTVFSLDRIREERDEAERQRLIAAEVNRFLNQDLLSAIDPQRTADREITMREVLDDAAAKLESRTFSDPLVEAALRTSVGWTYFSLGRRETALPHLERALALTRMVRGAEHPETAAAMTSLAILLDAFARYDESGELHRRSYEIREKLLGPTHPDTLTSINNLGSYFMELGRSNDALSWLERSLEARREAYGPDDSRVGVAAHQLAVLCYDLNRDTDAIRLYEEAVRIFRGAHGDDDPRVLVSRSALATALSNSTVARYQEAESIFREVIAVQTRVLGNDHPNALSTRASLAFCLIRGGNFAEAEREARAAITRAQASLPANDIVLGHLHRAAGTAHRKLGDLDAARSAYEHAFAVYDARGEGGARLRRETAVKLAEIVEAQGQSELAASWRARAEGQP